MFTEEYLQDLRRDRFRPAALVRYARQLGRKARADILANPAAARSIWTVALCFFAAAFVLSVPLAFFVERHLAKEFFLDSSVGILIAFGLVTPYVGLLRDRDGYALSALTLPCMVTLARVALIPGMVLFILERRLGLALAAFVLAGLSDVADGWLARRSRQETRLGTLMDPIVDILLNLAVFGALGAVGLVPQWVMGAATVRYGGLLTGGALIYLFHGPVRVAPTLFGRLVGVVMSVLVGLLLAVVMAGAPLERMESLTRDALGVLLCGGIVHGAVMGWYNLRLLTGEARNARRVIHDVRWGAS